MNSIKKYTVVALLVFSIIAAGQVSSNAEVAEYTIDQAHSQVIFKVKHLAISTVTGRFDVFEGSYAFDSEDISNSNVNADIKAASINTNEKDRDDHLRSKDFFDVEQYPDITFKSTSIKKADGENFEIVGDLTIHGVTKEVTLDAVFEGSAKDPRGNERTAFVADGKIYRKDFGMTWNKVLEAGGLVVGDEVKITLEIQGVRKQG
ncbi:MAG: YceI family protein [Thermodesulfobacteriota bacterium]